MARLGTLVVLPNRPLGADPDAVASLATAAGMEPLDVRLKTATGRAGVFARGAERAAMAATAGEIRALGHAAAVVTDEEVHALPWPRAARGVTPEGPLAFVDERGAVIAAPPPDARLWIGVANVRQAQPNRLPMNPGVAGAPDGAGVAVEVETELDWLCQSDRAGLLIDVAWNDGAERVRLRGDRLAFGTLGAHAAPSAARNLAFVLRRIATAGRVVTLDLEFEQFQPPRLGAGPPPRFPKGMDLPREDREAGWESYVRFNLAAWQLGLYATHTTPVTWSGAALRACRSALPEAPAAAPGRIGTDPRAERAVLLTRPEAEAGTPSEARRAADGAAIPGGWSRRWHDRLAAVGPPALVLGLALGTSAYGAVALVTRWATPWRELTLLGVAGLALTHALVLYDRLRRVQDVPASRIRSAAIGPCEIHGHARAGAPLRTPFSRMPCVWYEYRLVRRESTNASDVSLSVGGVRLGLGADGRNERVHVVTGHSNDVPFYIEDDTGRLAVDPRGAQVEVSTVQTLSQVPFAEAPLPPGTRVSITERYIPVDHPIWVMGHLQVAGDAESGRAEAWAACLRALKADQARMAVGDEDGDGIVDATEWDQLVAEARREWEIAELPATGRTDRLTIGRSARDGFFYITERSEKVVVRRFAWRAAMALAAGIGLAAWALMSLAGFGGR